MRQQRLKKLWRRLGVLQGQSNSQDELQLKFGAAKKEADRAADENQRRRRREVSWATPVNTPANPLAEVLSGSGRGLEKAH